MYIYMCVRRERNGNGDTGKMEGEDFRGPERGGAATWQRDERANIRTDHKQSS